jgi:hypothetical protein
MTGFLFILGLIFVILKIAGVISAWSWFFVLLPWIAAVIAWFLIFGGIALFVNLVGGKVRR